MKTDIFEITFDKAAIGMAHVDTNGRWIRVNQQLCDFLGYTREEFVHLTFQDITYQDDLELDLLHVRELFRGKKETFTIEKRYLRKDGKLTWAHLSVSAIRDNDKNILYFLACIVDINERKLLEIKNSETLASLKKAESLAKLGNWSLDIINNKLTWSDEIFNIFEIDPKRFEATYEAFLNAIHPEDRDMVNYIYNRSLETKEKYQIIHRLLQKGGKIKYVVERCETKFDPDGTPLLSIGTVQDITEMRETQNLLIESEQFYRTIVSSIDEAILILEDNVIIDCNPAAVYIFEKTKQALIGTNILNQSSCKIEYAHESFEHALVYAYQGMVTHIQCSLMFFTPQKSEKILDITLANYGNETNKLIMLVRDITQKLEEEKFFKMHARQAQMGEMIAMIAHQWRQPLSIINAIASQMRVKEMLKEEENGEYIHNLIKIEQQSSHLSQTISDYRDFFRPDKPKECVSLSEIIDHTLNLIDHSIKNKGISIIKKVADPVHVYIYRNEVLQVLISLVKNSLDAFEERGIEEKRITVEIEEDVPYGVIRISDNGGGISEEVLSKIFIPYFTTKNYAYGTGLGLYMSKTIIEEHCGGILRITSQGDETTVDIRLPYVSI